MTTAVLPYSGRTFSDVCVLCYVLYFFGKSELPIHTSSAKSETETISQRGVAEGRYAAMASAMHSLGYGGCVARVAFYDFH